MLGGFAEAPSHCVSSSPDVSLLISYKHLYMSQSLGDLADLDSSTLSSRSLRPATYPSRVHLRARHTSGPRQDRQAGPQRPTLRRPRSPPSQKAPLAPDASRKAAAPREHPQKVPAERAPIRKAQARPAAPKKSPVLASAPRKAPAGRAPSKTPQEAASRPVPSSEPLSLPTSSTQALTPRVHYQMAFDSADLGLGPAGSRAKGNTEPLVLVGTQEAQVTEVRARKMSLELPGHTAQQEAEEVVVGRTREIALDGLKGRAQAEDRLRSAKEERRVDLPGFRSQATRQRRKQVKTQQLVVEGAPGAPRRPFSAEELALARTMITGKAQAQEPPLRPRLFGLPSWLLLSRVSVRSTPGPEAFSLGPAATGEQPRLDPWVKAGVGVRVEEPRSVQEAAKPEKLPSVQRGPSKGRPRSPRVPRSPKLDRVSEAPIPLPATRWEEVPSLPTVSTTSPVSKLQARASQMLNREAAEEVVGGSSLENLTPMLVELEKKRNISNEMEQTERERDNFTSSPR